MGTSASRSQQVSDTGEVNSNVYVGENGPAWDIRAAVHVMLFILVAQFILLLRYTHRRTLKKQIRRSMAMIPLQGVRTEQP